eukprot:jgi/Chrzof1/6962/Cz02g05190.t1
MLDAALGGAVSEKQQKRLAAARHKTVVSEAYPESEFHAAAAASGDGELRLSDLLEGLGDAKHQLNASRKVLERLEKRSTPVAAPLPRLVQERQVRKAGYEAASKEVTKWQPMVKANREAPTLAFTAPSHEMSNVAASTKSLVASFTPEGDMESEVAALLQKAGAHTAKAMAEAEQALALKALSVDEARERAARLAKMRHLLFYAELKAKRLSKIKSKEYHRKMNKAAKRKAQQLGVAGEDNESARKAALEEAEFERAKERLTLKHKNTSRWARRALKRGVDVMDEGTKAAIAEQLSLGQQLKRKIEGVRSGSEEDSDDSTSASEDEGNDANGDAAQRRSSMSTKARKEALAILNGLAADPQTAEGDANGDGNPKSKKGLFALPFMARALERQRQQAQQEATALLQQMEGASGDEGGDAAGGGRLRFGGVQPLAGGNSLGVDEFGGSESDVEEDAEAKAVRLGKLLLGENGDHAGGAADISGDIPAVVNKADKAGETDTMGVGILAAATSGPVDIDMPELGPSGNVHYNSSKAGKQAVLGKASAVANGIPKASVRGGSSSVLEAVAQHQAARSWLFGRETSGNQPASAVAAVAAATDGQPTDIADLDLIDRQPGSSAVSSFIPAKKFMGPREGFVFKRSLQGLGYYADDTLPGLAVKHKKKSKKDSNVKQQQQQQQQQRKPLADDLGALQLQQQHAEHDDDDEEDSVQHANGSKGSTAHITGAAETNGDHSHAADALHDDVADADARHMQPLHNDADLQQQLLRRAFAGDDVEAEFTAEKAADVEGELPPVEAPGLMPGWGMWSNQQREPAWMKKEREKAEKTRQQAAASRKDAKMQHVVISEKWDKKASKYLTPQLPFPFNNKDVYESSIRQPLGRQYNPDAAFRNLTRPAVLKSTGVIIDPLRYSKPIAKYSSTTEAKARGVVTVAGGMPLKGSKVVYGVKKAAADSSSSKAASGRQATFSGGGGRKPTKRQ